jgi:type I restriction enzyme S subunit
MPAIVKTRTVQIGDCARVVNGFAFKSELFTAERTGLPVVRIREVVRGHSETRYTGEYPESAVIRNGDLLVGMDGEFNIARWQGGMALLNQRVCKIDAKQGVADIDYLRHALAIALKRIEYRTPFVTLKHLSSEELKDYEIPLPSLSDQQRIAGQLEQVDRLRRTRRYTLELSDTFLPAAFLQLVGATGDRFPQSTVEDLAADKPHAIRTGPFGSQLLHSEFTDSGIAVLGIDNAVNNRFVWDERRFITPEKYEQLQRYTVFPGDVIITIMGTCGRCAIVPDDIPTTINTKHLCCITLDHRCCLPIYLHGAFLHHPFVRHQLRVATKGAIMEGLNMEIIKELRIAVPPLPMQEQFAKLVARHDRLRAVQSESLRQAEHLFASLLHSAFMAG